MLGGAATWPLAARAQQSERMRHIGVLMGTAESVKIACLPLLLNQCCSEAPLKILIQQHLPTKDLAPAERLQNARRKKLIVGYKSWILPAMNGCSPNQQPRKGTAHEALLRPRRLLHGAAHRASRRRTHLRARALRHTPQQDRRRRRVLETQTQRLRSASHAGRRTVPGRGRGHLPVPRRPATPSRACSPIWNHGALPPDGSAELRIV